MRYKKILVPVDFSSCSVAALRHALDLAEASEGSIDVLHVEDSPGVEAGAIAGVEAELRDVLREMAERLGDRFSSRLDAGDPVVRILEACADRPYDLIVMGTHGRVGRLHMLAHSVAEAVIRNAPCPVLTVRVPSGDMSFKEGMRGGREVVGHYPQH
jgi:universal stress protein A